MFVTCLYRAVYTYSLRKSINRKYIYNTFQFFWTKCNLIADFKFHSGYALKWELCVWRAINVYYKTQDEKRLLKAKTPWNGWRLLRRGNECIYMHDHAGNVIHTCALMNNVRNRACYIDKCLLVVLGHGENWRLVMGFR